MGAKDRAQRILSKGLATLTHLPRLPNSTGTQVTRVKMVKREAGANSWRSAPDPQLGRLIPQEGGPKQDRHAAEPEPTPPRPGF